MSDRSDIEWTDATYNPIRGIAPNRHMCSKISPGCDNCYASALNYRFGGDEFQRGRTDVAVRLDEKALLLPLKWQAPRRVFVCSMTDLFGEWVPDEWIDQVFGVMEIADHHQYQVLTKRPSRMLSWLKRTTLATNTPFLQAVSIPGSTATRTVVDLAIGRFDPWPLPNVWLGVSIEEDRFSWRAEVLKDCPAAVRFVSAEPLLGPLPTLSLSGIDWLITGGESGVRHRPIEAEWVRDLRDRSQAAGVAFFHKQWGGRTHAEGGRELDGRTWDEYPKALVTA